MQKISDKCSKARAIKSGFTLIEMLIVVLIIGILAAIALPQYQLARDKSKFSTYQALVKTIAEAQRRYYLISGTWTGQLTDLDIELPKGTNVTLYLGTGIIYDNEWYCHMQPARTHSTPAYVQCSDKDYHGYGEEVATITGVPEYNIQTCHTLENDARGIRLCKALGGALSYCTGIIMNPISGNRAGCVYKLK